ncbi:hypothetical protein Vretimale_18316 [Volvox reticuliferus]|uniref:RING-type domain-containing protein n=1 Tax=Volvox reticuliferus TaxID=1737510 RepID=A0A8J4CBV6_9CHLO|nr:hypothetical protein Vretifemale_8779 [Volvox reticuliferus]GIM15556.1 hypothetical protein Vretimale_18316 [Volvox reticuliferus]
MLVMCRLLGCLSQVFKRKASTTSLGASEHPNHHHGDRYHNGDRNHGRSAQPNGMAVGSTHPTASNPPAGQATVVERHSAPPGPLNVTAALTAPAPPFEGDLHGGTVASASAIAAATQPATLVKLDRGAPSRRTPLHVAAERGQLHVLSAIIENLCCAATAALLAEDSSVAGATDDGAQLQGGGGGGDPSTTYVWSTATENAEGGTSGRHQQQHRQRGSGARLGSGQPQHYRNNVAMVDEFPIARPGAGGAPLAPEQYIQFHLNMQDAEGITALSLACRYGHVDCCRLLLANGSARMLSDARGNTPLHYAALRGHLGVLFMLLDEFMDPAHEEEFNGYVDVRNHAGCTPLHYAVWGRQSGSVQVLLQHGADVMPRNSLPAQELTPPVMVVGSTPLHLAAARGHVEICRIILKTFAERVLEPLQLSEDDPQPPTLASLDPRVQVNGNGHMPYQVAQRLGFYPLAMLLRPSIPILRLFSDEERAVRFYGPAPLRAIAAEALNKKLLMELDSLATGVIAQATAVGVREKASEIITQQPAAMTTAAAAAASNGGSGANSASDAGTSAQRPVSAPATLEQLAAAAALEAEEEASGGGGGDRGADAAAGYYQRHHSLVADESTTTAASGTSRTSRLGVAASPVAGASVATSTIVAGAGQRAMPLRQLNVEIAVAGGTLDNDGRPSGAARRPLVSEVLSPGPAAPSPSSGAAQPVPPRTPPVGIPIAAQAQSPSGVSPRLMSPIALMPPSPSAGSGPSFASGGSGGASPSALQYPSPPQLQLTSRGSSARRSTPPLTNNRSSNAMLPAAAPLVAALSRPPSAPRANGQPAQSSHGQVMVSLPGQPDVPELQALRTLPAREQANGEPVSPAASAVEPGAGAAGSRPLGDGSGLALAATSGTTADSGAVTVYGPRTPVRQPSAGTLHARPLTGSPLEAGATLTSLGIAQGSSNGGVSGSITSLSGTRPATSSLATISSSSLAVVLEGRSPSTRRSNDGSRPPGLVRLRSNPLFEDVHGANSTAATSLGPAGGSGSGGGTMAAAATLNSMPPVAEVASEGEEGGPSEGTSRLSCAAVTPFASRLSGTGAGGGGSSGNSSASQNHGADRTVTTGNGNGAPMATMTTVNTSTGRPTAAAAAVAAAAASLPAVDDEDLECGVCMEPLPMVAISPCRHQICGPCARRICCLNIQKPSHCPFCRATISAFVAPAPLTPTAA